MTDLALTKTSDMILFVYSRRKFTSLTNGNCEEGPDKTGQWGFVESSHRPHCNCLRCRKQLADISSILVELNSIVQFISHVVYFKFYHSKDPNFYWS